MNHTHTQAAYMVACVYTLFAVGLVSRFLSPLPRLLLPQLSGQQFQHINQWLDLAEPSVPSGCFLKVRRQSQTAGTTGQWP